MEKLIIIGDIHGRIIWKKILEKEKNYTKVIFLGDYFDARDPNITPIIERDNFEEILKIENSIILLGNHDNHYFPNTYDRCSGFNIETKRLISTLLDKKKFKICYKYNNFIFTHAGVSFNFLNSVFKEYDLEKIDDLLNNLYLEKPNYFDFNQRCYNPYGDDVIQSPLWIRPYSLELSNKDTELKKYIQVFGHSNFYDNTYENYIGLDKLDQEKYGVIENNNLIIKKL